MKKFFGSLENNKKKQLEIMCISIIVLLTVYIPALNLVKTLRERERIAEVDYESIISIKADKKESGKLILSGWVVRENSKNKELKLVLNSESETEKYISADIYNWAEVGKYFNPNEDYGSCGFTVSIKESKLEKDECYEIAIVLKYEQNGVVKNKKIKTRQYLYNGDVYNYNPKEFLLPYTKNDELNEVITNGSLCLYDKNNNIWIYERDGKLYYIFTSQLLKNKNIGIPVMPHTSRVELLSTERLEVGFDHLGFYVEEDSYSKEDIEPYQMIVVELPDQYPITYIDTGLYDNSQKKWIKNYKIFLQEWNERRFKK